jgi:Ran GTPase-activating protein (RanGAP) involved in mRNA processing and transport
MKYTPFLRVLGIGGNSIGDQGILAIAEALAEVSELATLSVGGCDFGNEGMQAVASALHHLPLLKTLWINWNRFDDVGAREFVRVIDVLRGGQLIALSGVLLSQYAKELGCPKGVIADLTNDDDANRAILDFIRHRK